MERARTAVLGAMAGGLFAITSLIDTRFGFKIYNSDETTPATIAVVVLAGAVAGATFLRLWPLVLVGLMLGLGAGIWFRDNGDATGYVQPPWVFVLLFGLPLAGAAAGYVLHRRLRVRDG